MKIEVSNGELADKVSILSIKLMKIAAKDKLRNIQKEYDLLYKDMRRIGVTPDDSRFKSLASVNSQLWDIEDRIRLKEVDKEFDDEFIDLARQVYHLNDKRAEIKREINLSTGSMIIEEKEYVKY
ncbi:MAG: hypothetical protein HKM93_14910 [Desulfobacteraceae bacterium]|nr:hypothetical protein [Desulfobacteraceae bacterium]